MAIVGTHRDLFKCKKEHIGLILLGIFLETGLLTVELDEAEEARLRKMFGGNPGVDSLHHRFVSAALENGLEHQIDDWNFSSNSHRRRISVYDPSRIKNPPF